MDSVVKGSTPICEECAVVLVDAYALSHCQAQPGEGPQPGTMRYHYCVRVQPLQIYNAVQRNFVAGSDISFHLY